MIIGNKITSTTWPGLQISGGQQRAIALVSYVAPANGFIVGIGGFCREISGSNPRVGWAIWALDPDGTPTERSAYTGRIQVNGSGMDAYGPVAWSDPDLGGAPTALRVVAGQRFAIGLKVDSGTLEVATLGGVTTLFSRNGISGTGPPTDPFGATSTPAGESLAIYVEFSENRSPSVALTAPADGVALNTSNPVFTGTFTDLDTAAPFIDRMGAYAIEVTRVSDGALMWSEVFLASDAEKTAAAFSRPYTGSNDLPSGTGPYSWMAKVMDESGAESPWSAPRTFTINAGGQVSTEAVAEPAAKIDGDPAALNWQGQWFHPTALQANQARVRLLINGTEFKVGATVAIGPINSSSLPGTLFTIAAASAGIGVLEPGTYEWQIQAKATDGQWSPWSDPRVVVINSPPTVPANLKPTNGEVLTQRPLAEWNVTDPDSDDVYGVDDDSELLLTRPNGTSVTIITNNYNTGTGKAFHQFTSGEVLDAVRGVYRWKVRGRDSSAGARGIGQWSQEHAFEYVEGPQVTISSPAEAATVTTSVPTLTWVTTGGQERFRVRAYLQDAEHAFKSSGEIAGSANSWQIPVGWFQNENNYDVDVTAWSGGNIPGTSPRRSFRIEYAGPLPLGTPEATLYRNRFDPIIVGLVEPSSILVSWPESALNPDEFAGYNVRRRIQTDAPETAILLATVSERGQNRWIDHLAPPNTPLVYMISQLRRVSAAEVLESEPAEVLVTLPRSVPILCSATNPGELRFPVMWLNEDLGGDFLRDQSIVKTWGARGRRTNQRTPAAYGAKSVKIGVTIRDDERGDMYDHFDAIDDLIESGDTLCWGPQRPRERMFAALEGSTPWQRVGNGRKRTMSLIEVDHTEGIRE
jgi:hypothetical protein